MSTATTNLSLAKWDPATEGTTKFDLDTMLNANWDKIDAKATVTGTPASAVATGTAGSIRWDASYIYVCVATNTWKRVAIVTW